MLPGGSFTAVAPNPTPLPPGGTAVQARSLSLSRDMPPSHHTSSFCLHPHGSPSLCPLLACGHQHCMGPMTEPVALSQGHPVLSIATHPLTSPATSCLALSVLGSPPTVPAPCTGHTAVTTRSCPVPRGGSTLSGDLLCHSQGQTGAGGSPHIATGARHHAKVPEALPSPEA